MLRSTTCSLLAERVTEGGAHFVRVHEDRVELRVAEMDLEAASLSAELSIRDAEEALEEEECEEEEDHDDDDHDEHDEEEEA